MLGFTETNNYIHIKYIIGLKTLVHKQFYSFKFLVINFSP